jgi:hypothetical protein
VFEKKEKNAFTMKQPSLTGKNEEDCPFYEKSFFVVVFFLCW